MIDVPISVRDALKDGRLKKYYRILCSRPEKSRSTTYFTLATLSNEDDTTNRTTIFNAGQYRLYNSELNFGFNLILTTVSSGRTKIDQVPAVPGATQTEYFFSVMEETEVYVNILSPGTEIDVQTVVKEIEKTDYVYDFTLDNDSLVHESVKIDERTCSTETLKFGLCEGSSIELQYFGHPNINGYKLQAFIDVCYEGEGWAQKALLTNNDDSYVIKEAGDYKAVIPAGVSGSLEYTDLDGFIITYNIYQSVTEQSISLPNCKKNESVKVISSGTFLVNIMIFTTQPTYTIPLGFFYVDQCSRQASTGIHKITAYNKLKSEYLDANANTMLDIDFVNPSIELTLYDIQKTLLNDYQTGLVEEITLTPSMAAWLWTKGYTASYKKKTFASGSLTSPLNNRMFGLTYTSSATATCVQRCNVIHYDMIADNTYVLQTDENLNDQEDILLAAISRAITKSGISSPAAQIKKVVQSITYDYSSYDGQDPPSNFPTNLKGWAYIYSVILMKSDGTYEWYSKVGYTNKMTGCKGSIQDLTHKILTGYEDMWVVMPRSFGKGNMNQGTWQELWTIGSQSAYEYYDTNGDPRDGGYYPAEQLGNLLPQAGQISGLIPANYITVDPYNLPDFTLRDVLRSTYETVCQYGRLNRETDLFKGMPLNNTRLYPAETLYPADSLYPVGTSESGDSSSYSKLWTDSSSPDTFRNLVITYKGLDVNNMPRDFVLEKEINPDGTKDYICDNNWIFKNMIWTQDQIQAYADTMADLMRGIKWIPFEMWAAGLPYLETGDEIEIHTPDGTFPSYILQRTLSGIQNLQDTYINGSLDIF